MQFVNQFVVPAPVDEASRMMVLDARGKENSGRGSAAAVVHVDLTPEGPSRTAVHVTTDLQITGKVAQFGRSAMADVGERLIGQFAGNLESLLGAAPATSVDGSEGGADADARHLGNAGAELNALSLAAPLLKRAVPTVVALVVGLVIGRLLGGRGRPNAPTAPRLLDVAPTDG